MSFAKRCLERAEKASPGPWRIGHMNEVYPFADVDDANGVSIAEEVSMNDAVFIAHSRVLVVELAMRLEKACKALRDCEVTEDNNGFARSYHPHRALADELERTI